MKEVFAILKISGLFWRWKLDGRSPLIAVTTFVYSLRNTPRVYGGSRNDCVALACFRVRVLYSECVCECGCALVWERVCVRAADVVSERVSVYER